MSYRITYTKRFEKHFSKMTQIEKKQIKAKVDYYLRIPFTLLCVQNGYRERKIFSNAV